MDYLAFLRGILLLVSFLATVRCASALDFNLRTATIDKDGIQNEQSYFQYDRATNVFLDLPRRWSISSSADAIVAIPLDSRRAYVRIERSTFTAETKFEPAEREVYRKKVSSALKELSGALRSVEERENVLPVFGWTSLEFLVDFEAFGSTYRGSVLFLNLNAKEQLQVTMVGSAQEFEELRGAGLRILRSWRVVPAGR